MTMITKVTARDVVLAAAKARPSAPAVIVIATWEHVGT